MHLRALALVEGFLALALIMFVRVGQWLFEGLEDGLGSGAIPWHKPEEAY